MSKIKKINLEKGMYKDAEKEGISFAEFLETQDPTENYTGELAKMTAFERQLAERNLNVQGGNAVLVKTFFDTNDNKILFPEYLNQQILSGLMLGEDSANINDIVAAETPVDSNIVNAIAFDYDKTDMKYKRVAEGAEFSKATIVVQGKAIDLYKIGTEIQASYEAIADMKVNVLGLFMQDLGLQLGMDLVYAALLTLISGDGNSNPAQVIGVTTPGTLTYDDMLHFLFAFESGYKPTTIVSNNIAMEKVYKIAEFKQALVAAKWMQDGSPMTPFGQIYKTNPRLSNTMIVALKKAICLQMYKRKGAQLIESEKVISKQIEKSVVSMRIGFSKLMTKCCKVLDTSVQG